MYYQGILVLAVFTMVFASSCKKDDDGDGPIDTSCTETREFWLDGSVNEEPFITSEPCGNLRLSEVEVGQYWQVGDIFTFYSQQVINDSIGNAKDSFRLSIATFVDPALVDTVIYNGDTTFSLSATNICNVMKMGKHYLYLHEASQNNANAFLVNYIDENGTAWRPIPAPVTDSTFVITSIDGIVSQNPFSGAYFPYCTISFSYDLLMQQVQSTNTDTLHLKGTGRLGFR